MNRILVALNAQKDVYKLLIAAALFGASLLLLSAEKGLENRFDAGAQEYAADKELSLNQDRYKQIYQQMLAGASQASVQKMEQNDWIRATQELVGNRQLLLQELTPVTSVSGRGTDLQIRLEGTTQNIAEFLRDLSRNADAVSASRLNLSRQPEKNSVQAEILLIQD